MKIILAGPDRQALMNEAYVAFAASGADLAGVTDSVDELVLLAGGLGQGAIVVVEAELWNDTDQAREGLAALAPAGVVVILPSWWDREEAAFAQLPNLVAGFTAPVTWAQVAGEVKKRAGHRAKPATSERPEQPTSREPQPEPPVGAAPTGADQLPAVVEPAPSVRQAEQEPFARKQPQARRVVAFWSGPAGGTGRTTLALACGILAAEWGADPLLLALAEPAVSAILRMARTPNVGAFFDGGDLAAAIQRVSWGDHSLPVALGPARSGDGLQAGHVQIAALIEVARSIHSTVLIDLPPLTPSGNVWSLVGVNAATDVVLVIPYSSTGVAAAIDALVSLREAKAGGRVRLVLNRVHPGAIRQRQVVESITGLWGSCPASVELPHLPGLADVLEQGSLPRVLQNPQESRFLGGGGEAGWTNAIATLLEVAAGLERPVPIEEEIVPEQPRKTSGQPERPVRKKRGLGGLIQIEVVD